MLRLALLPLLLVAGCASTPPAQQFKVRPAQAEQSPFTLNGRITVKHNGERLSASVNWAHSTGEDNILLLAPLGQTVAHIVRDAQGVVLEASGKRYAAADAEELTQQVLGWKLPLDGLCYWVLALPAPGDSKAVIERDANERVSVMYQDDWEIRYSRYASPLPDSLPLRLWLQRDELDIQLLIDEWEIPSTH